MPHGGCGALCICITAPHYFSFPNINICVQISPLPASELLMGLWAPLKCILATLLYRTHRPHLDASSSINLPAGYFRISCGIIASTYHVFGAVLCNIMKRALKCRFWPRVENFEENNVFMKSQFWPRVAIFWGNNFLKSWFLTAISDFYEEKLILKIFILTAISDFYGEYCFFKIFILTAINDFRGNDSIEK